MSKPVVIIGAGPAGLACARTLSRANVPVVVLDDNPRPGGQYFRQLPQSFEAGTDSRLLRDVGRVADLVACLEHPQVRYLPETTAWMVPTPGVVAYAGASGSGRVEASHIVLATGAHDKPVPFPGWTTPGVISAGGALNLAKGQGQAPQGRVIVVGNGPLLLVVAATLVAAGSQVTHVVECAPGRQAWGALPQMIHAPRLLWKGMDYRRRLLAGGTRVMTGWTITEAIGTPQVSAARLAPLTGSGELRQTHAITLPVDWIVTGFGLQPSSELARHLGCQMRFDADRGGWIPSRSANLETSLPNVFAIGDGAGIGGVEVALTEGGLAANAVLARLGQLGPDERKLRGTISSLGKFRAGLDRLYRAPSPMLARDTTIVCRCEEVTAGEVQDAIDAGATDLVRLKGALRLGMGRCQGRNCYTAAALQISRRQGQELEQCPLPRSRAPVRPVRIDDMLVEALPPAKEPDSIILFERPEEKNQSNS